MFDGKNFDSVHALLAVASHTSQPCSSCSPTGEAVRPMLKSGPMDGFYHKTLSMFQYYLHDSNTDCSGNASGIACVGLGVLMYMKKWICVTFRSVNMCEFSKKNV